MNREVEKRKENRSCVRERTASGIEAIVVEEKHDEITRQDDRANDDQDCIVVRTLNVESTNR